MDIGERISYYRKSRGLTQAELAELMEVSFQAVSSWELGRYAPDLSRINKLADVLGIPAERLLSDMPESALPVRTRFSNEEHMYTFLKTACRSARNIPKLLPFCREAYAGQTLPGTDVPFFNLPLSMACHCLSLGLGETAAEAALVSNVPLMPGHGNTVLPVDEQTAAAVRLFVRAGRGSYEKAAFEKDTLASLLLILDAVHRPTAGKYTAAETRALALKAEERALPLIPVLKKGTPAENDAAWVLSFILMQQTELIRRFT